VRVPLPDRPAGEPALAVTLTVAETLARGFLMPVVALGTIPT
jgi:hypothetical protein